MLEATRRFEQFPPNRGLGQSPKFDGLLGSVDMFKIWWRPKAWSQLCAVVAPWLVEKLQILVNVLKMLDEKISQAKIALARRCSGPRPKGVGALSQMQLQSEVLDWSLYSNRRKIACLAGMVPSEWSTGEKERRGSITKVGVPALRRIIVEMVWRMKLFQPDYKPVQKWREVLEGTNPALKKKVLLFTSIALAVGAAFKV